MDIKALAKAQAKMDAMEETASSRRAFEVFYNNGTIRTEAEVADIVGVSQQTINNWKHTFAWEDRITQIKRGTYLRRATGRDRDLIDSIDESLGIIAVFKSKYKQALIDFNIEDITDLAVKDVVSLVKLEIDLLNAKTNYFKTIADCADVLRAEIQEQINMGNADKIVIGEIEASLRTMISASDEAKEHIKTKLLLRLGEPDEQDYDRSN